MAPYSVNSGQRVRPGITWCVGETLRRTLKHVFFEFGTTLASRHDLIVWKSVRGKEPTERGVPCQNFYGVLLFY